MVTVKLLLLLETLHFYTKKGEGDFSKRFTVSRNATLNS